MRARGTPKSCQPAPGDQPNGPTTLKKTDRENDIGTTETKDSPSRLRTPSKQETSSRQGKLQRLFGGSKKQSLVMALVSPRNASEHVPETPSVQREAQRRDVGQASALSNHASRTEPRRQPHRMTRTETAGRAAMKRHSMHGNGIAWESRAGYIATPDGKPQRAHYEAVPAPLFSPQPYMETPWANPTPPPMPPRRRSLSATFNPTWSDEQQVPLRDEILRETLGVQDPSAYGADRGSPVQTRRTYAKPTLKPSPDPGSRNRTTQSRTLKCTASAPNLMSPPPASPRPPLPSPTVSLNNAQRPTSARAHSFRSVHDPMPTQAHFSRNMEVATSLSRQSSRESSHGYWRSRSARSFDAAQAGTQPNLRHSYAVYGRHPPVVYRQPRGLQAHDGEGPSYRILHSYNSPAYKYAPVWC